MAPRWLDEDERRAWLGYRQMRLLLDAAISRDLLKDSALSDADYDVLSNLSESPGRRGRLSDLAARMLWSVSRLSHHISRMEERGLVMRESVPSDGRGAFVSLTPKGLRTIRKAAPHHVASVREHFIDRLNPEEIKTYAEIAEAVVRGLDPLPRDPV